MTQLLQSVPSSVLSAAEKTGLLLMREEEKLTRYVYNVLLAQAMRSLDDATNVGITIEDLDIRDLMDLIAASDNDDIRIVYQNLLKGSRNHLPSFAGRLAN